MKIEVCFHCTGTGKIVEEDRYDSYTYVCNNCEGSGRIYTGTFYYSVPYTTQLNKIYKADSEIHGILNKLQVIPTDKKEWNP